MVDRLACLVARRNIRIRWLRWYWFENKHLLRLDDEQRAWLIQLHLQLPYHFQSQPHHFLPPHLSLLQVLASLHFVMAYGVPFIISVQLQKIIIFFFYSLSPRTDSRLIRVGAGVFPVFLTGPLAQWLSSIPRVIRLTGMSDWDRSLSRNKSYPSTSTSTLCATSCSYESTGI